ncbi:MAG: DUF4041 domain-containing protein [Myxococcales bacterium]|nr:DUF4041 domain-containing protein [Myxococcales bacterium]
MLLYARERRQHAETREERDGLLPYRIIPDAQAEAARIQAQANDDATRLRTQADAEAQQLRAAAGAELEQARASSTALVAQGQTQAAQLVDAARRQAQQITSAAEQRAQEDRARSNAIALEGRRLEQESITAAARLIEEAERKAQEIAGDALRARDQAEVYKQAARAIKNTVHGYGDEYLVPAQSVLDELAEAFDHKEAGQKLQEARGISAAMVEEGRAAACDYKEDRRRINAIRFVVDAFNGKVDSILSKVKHDNFGTLAQKIRDAFALVNMGGQAFKNARITEEYLESRLAELTWAVRAMELQRLEREEQKRIKEQLREEERARKEYEKAIRDAEKEERMLQKAMESARKHLAAASEAERQEYEQQLSELQKKLEEAEAKNQRALSMAQQTRRGHVYIISNVGSFGEDVYKIGLTRRLEPTDRVKELGDASVPFSFDIHAMIWAEDAPALETELHRVFQEAQVNKVNPRKEFFRLRLKDIREAVEARGFDIHWTMVAEAREYRESEALRKKRASESITLAMTSTA